MEDEDKQVSQEQKSFEEESSRNLEDWKEELIRQQNLDE